MKQNRKHFASNRYLVSTLVVLVVIAATCSAVITEHNTTDAAPSVKPVAATARSQFSFASVSGWWQGATNKTSMALFHNSQDCFASAEYKAGIVDATAELHNAVASQVSSGYTVTPGSIQMLTLQTNIGTQKYELHQYSVTGTGSLGKLEGGQEFGYVQLAGGYVKVEGYCDTPAELPDTIPALQAIRFDAVE